jgi:transposase
MAGELVVMSTREIDRLGVVQQILERRLTRTKAGELLGIGPKQVARLCNAFKRDGAAGLVSRKRGRVGNRKLDAEVEARAVALVRAFYEDFGPTLAREKLLERHGIKLSKETVRKILSKAGIWLPKDQRIPKPHQPRFRRECLGELVQIDGSEHYWFEDRGPYCTLLVYVDDATSRLMELRFAESESAFSYFAATESYLKRHGKPVAFYSDKHSIFRAARANPAGDHGGVTQFARALAELNIDIICANTPQAKGRVERMNSTLQDRLVKELRLANIATMDAANAFVPAFIESFNAKFAKAPRNPHDAHRPLATTDNLDALFCIRDVRSMTPNLVVQMEGQSYVVTPGPTTTPLSGRRRSVLVHTWADGRREIHHEGKSLPYTIPDEYPYPTPAQIVDRKQIAEAMKRMQAAQEDPQRRFAAAKRFAVRRKVQKAGPAGATSSSVPHLRRKPKNTGRRMDASLTKSDFADAPARVRYLVRWQAGDACLFERLFTGASGARGIGPFTERRLGPVDARVAIRWETRNDPSLPPPLIGGKVPPEASKRATTRLPPPSPPQKRGKTRPVADALRAPLPSAESRLSAALWFADVSRSAEIERIRKFNDTVDEYNREWLAELTREQPGKRKGPRRGAPPHRQVVESGRAREGQGSPRFARRLRRP